ncbi:tumor protein p53 inducible nuclear protein 1 S homeolog [Xenopus laevis]|uniref:LOC494664 protein n=1 Tax=Xenopus laevis TaxID=8355 RepID=Q640I5_XENLA|nr:tumor protein p53 inducible nuclear protein 1 S homeolog [Xenopus laevis]AAH82640.1 LOC494664 protein [Xenopus laevis]
MFARECSNVPSQETKLSEKEDDEWIVVDFIAQVDPGSRFSEEAATFEVISHSDEKPVTTQVPNAFEHLGTTSDSCFIHFNLCPMEESWFVTPPPCFTAGELTSVAVKTSPLENLLIEHPSMSVYAVNNLCHKSETKSESGFPSHDRIESDTEDKKKGKHLHCSIASLAARMKGLENTKTFVGDKLTKRHLEKHVNRKGLRRQNLIRGCRSQQIKHSRLLVHQPSLRQYNY